MMTQTHPVEKSSVTERPPGSVVAPLTYTTKKPEKLVYLITEMGEDEDSPEYHEWYDVHDMVIHDARRAVSEFSFDREGFMLCHSASRVEDFYDDTNIKAVYNEEVEKLVIAETGASRVLVFDHTIRVGSDDVRRERQVREVVNLVHNDYTTDSGPQRVTDLLRENKIIQDIETRFAIFNLWRSIAGPVLSSPLALLDAQSVSSRDWVPCDLDYGDRMGEIYNVAFNTDHRWYYFPIMTAEEILMFKNFDSAEDGRARFTPHTAFSDPTTPPESPHRESIETRVLAFFTDED
jgi:hypothetical protein